MYGQIDNGVLRRKRKDYWKKEERERAVRSHRRWAAIPSGGVAASLNEEIRSVAGFCKMQRRVCVCVCVDQINGCRPGRRSIDLSIDRTHLTIGTRARNRRRGPLQKGNKKTQKRNKKWKKEETFARWVCWRAWLAVFPISRPERGRGQGAWLPGCRLPRHWFLFLCVFNNELLWKSNIFWPAIVEAWGEWWRCATFIVGPSKRWGKGEKGTKKKWNRFLDCFFFLFFFFLSYRYLKARASTFRRGRASPGPCCWPKWRNEWWRRWWHPGTLPVDPDSFENI